MCQIWSELQDMSGWFGEQRVKVIVVVVVVACISASLCFYSLCTLLNSHRCPIACPCVGDTQTAIHSLRHDA